MAVIWPGIPREAGTASEYAGTPGERGRGEGATAPVNDFPVYQCLQVGTSLLCLFALAARMFRAIVCAQLQQLPLAQVFVIMFAFPLSCGFLFFESSTNGPLVALA